MSDNKIKNYKAWIDQWAITGKALKRIKNQELATFDHQKKKDIIDDILQIAFDNKKTRFTSGLIEQQKWFMKLIKKQEKNESII